MRGIRVNNGVVFVEIDGITIRYSPSGKCDLSPILFMNLEWDLRSTPPSEWEYMTESDIKGLENDGYKRIMEVYEDFCSIVEWNLGEKKHES